MVRMATVACVLASASMASAAIVFQDGAFSAPTGKMTWTQGVDALSTYYTNTTGGQAATLVASGGNPGSFLQQNQWGCTVLFAVAAPAGAEDWKITFDWKRDNTWGDRNFEVWALNAGGSINLNDTNYRTFGQTAAVTGGTQLVNGQLGNNVAAWTAQEFAFTVPSGASSVLFTWFTDGGGATGQIDNIAVTSVPEPATVGVVAGAAIFLMRRRRSH